jgi:hypothetical protein
LSSRLLQTNTNPIEETYLSACSDPLPSDSYNSSALVLATSAVAAPLILAPLRARSSTDSVAVRKGLADGSGKPSSLSFPFSPLTACDVKALFNTWGIELFSTSDKANNAIDCFKNLDFLQFEQFINEVAVALHTATVEHMGSSTISHKST